MLDSQLYPFKHSLISSIRIRYQMFQILKTDYFHLWFFYKKDFRISTAGKHKGVITELNTQNLD